MKKLTNTRTTRKVVMTVLGVHVSLLLLWWGGISILGMAALLMLPIMGTTVWLAYHMGLNKAEASTEKKGANKDSLSGVATFHMPFRG